MTGLGRRGLPRQAAGTIEAAILDCAWSLVIIDKADRLSINARAYPQHLPTADISRSDKRHKRPFKCLLETHQDMPAMLRANPRIGHHGIGPP